MSPTFLSLHYFNSRTLVPIENFGRSPITFDIMCQKKTDEIMNDENKTAHKSRNN